MITLKSKTQSFKRSDILQIFNVIQKLTKNLANSYRCLRFKIRQLVILHRGAFMGRLKRWIYAFKKTVLLVAANLTQLSIKVKQF